MLAGSHRENSWFQSESHIISVLLWCSRLKRTVSITCPFTEANHFGLLCCSLPYHFRAKKSKDTLKKCEMRERITPKLIKLSRSGSRLPGNNQFISQISFCLCLPFYPSKQELYRVSKYIQLQALT